jgi:hypothetical protein
MKIQFSQAVSFACALAAVAGAATAQITPIFTNITGAPGNVVPGLSNGWKPGLTSQFDRAYVSPDGQRWVLKGQANEITANDTIVVVGSGPSRTGAQLIMQEQVTPIDGVLFPESLDQQMGINNAGQVALAINTLGGTTIDETIVRYSSGTGLTLVAQEGTNYASLFPGNNLGITLDSPSITSDGTVAFRGVYATGASQPDFPAAGQANFLFLGDGFIAREGVTIPTGADFPWDNFTSGAYFVNSDGTKYLAAGDDESTPLTQDGILVHNGAVVIREGTPILDGVFPSTIALEYAMSGNGDHWIIRGSASGTGVVGDYAIVNGTLVASTDQPVTPGSFEFFDDAPFANCFFSIAINNNGDYVIGGTTTALDPTANAILVLNGQQIVVREGDPVDLNENGDPNDDGVFISVFNNDDAFLTDDLGYYFMADLRDGTGANVGQAFLFIDLSGLGSDCPPCAADYDNNGGVDGGDLGAFFADFEAGETCADVDGNGGVDGGDLGFFFGVFEVGGCN